MAEDRKIIIDEDWKAQVQAEKDAAVKQTAGGAAGEKKVDHSASAVAGADVADSPMPPASFEMLVTTLATEALVALGQVPHPATGKAQLHRHQAQYLIDTLDVLRQKTKGNLDANEQQMIDSLLHQLRMAFIEIVNRPATTADSPKDVGVGR